MEWSVARCVCEYHFSAVKTSFRRETPHSLRQFLCPILQPTARRSRGWHPSSVMWSLLKSCTTSYLPLGSCHNFSPPRIFGPEDFHWRFDPISSLNTYEVNSPLLEFLGLVLSSPALRCTRLALTCLSARLDRDVENLISKFSEGFRAKILFRL